MILHLDMVIVLLTSKKLLPIMVVSIGAIVIIATVVILFVVPLRSSLLTIPNKDLVKVYPQILYPTQLRVGQEGSFSPNLYEIDSNNEPQRNLPYLFEWNFGDGTNSTLQKINNYINNDQYGVSTNYELKHTYTHEGTYQVTLKATDGKGNTGTQSALIKVVR
jgi:hypothetical protein